MASLPPPPPTLEQPPEQPPQVGMRFHPKDKELVNDFLAKWLQDVPLPRYANITALIDLYAYHPSRVFDMGGDPAGVNGDEDDEEEDAEEDDNGRRNNSKKQIKKKRYFMTPLKKVSTKGQGKRMVRTVEGFGTWKLEFTKDVKDKGAVIGYRKYFKYDKSDKKCKKRQHDVHQEADNNDDEWGMHEYTHVENSMFALCCITRKRTRTSSTSKRIRRANNNNVNVNATSNDKEGDVNNYSMMSTENNIVVDQDRDHHEIPSIIVANNAYNWVPPDDAFMELSTNHEIPSGMLAQSNRETEASDHYHEHFKEITIEEALESINYGVPIVEDEQQHEQQHHQNLIVEEQQQQHQPQRQGDGYNDFAMQLEAELVERSENQAAVEQQQLDDPDQVAMMELDALISRNIKKKAVEKQPDDYWYNM